MRRTPTILIVAALITLIFSGCGSSQDSLAPIAATQTSAAPPAPAAPATTATATTAPSPTTQAVAPKPKIRQKPAKLPVNANVTHFALLKGLTKVGNTWWLDYDRAYYCEGEAQDDPGCAGPNPIELDNGVWIINNNPTMTHARVAATLKMTLYTETSTPKPFTQGLPAADQMDHRNGMHWAGADGQGGIWAVLDYDNTGNIKVIEQYWTP
ncbi:hypothetical protein ABEG17_06600 [Pedococcus sp. KACC 23699]|uniref:Uncharacterized protein n=1 Tax=Pedococcus sp. KACC 23699 TaxID=3149228 RepID=A0AAU7JY43_9MICO